MKGGARTLALWGAFLGMLAFVLSVVFGGTWLEDLLAWVASVGVLTTAALLLGARGHAPAADRDGDRPVTEFSVASAFAAIAIAAILLGLQFGVWLVEIGAGMLAFGIAGLVREWRWELRARGGRR